jgi:predicted peroxiredoxin
MKRNDIDETICETMKQVSEGVKQAREAGVKIPGHSTLVAFKLSTEDGRPVSLNLQLDIPEPEA